MSKGDDQESFNDKMYKDPALRAEIDAGIAKVDAKHAKGAREKSGATPDGPDVTAAQLAARRGSVGSSHHFRFQRLGIDTNDDPRQDTFLVVQMSGVEAVSQPYRFYLHLAYKFDSETNKGQPPPTAAELFEDRVKLTIRADDEKASRAVFGILSRVELLGRLNQHVIYGVEIVPPIWKAHWRTNLRVHTKRGKAETTQQIIEALLKKGDYRGTADLQWKLDQADNYKKRDFCAQYRETDYAFIARLLEDEGIWYRFDFSGDDVAMVFGDTNEAFEWRKYALEFNPTKGAPDTGFVRNLALTDQRRPDHAVLRDYHFKDGSPWRKAADEDAKASDNGHNAFSLYDYPGGFVVNADGGDQAGSDSMSADTVDEKLLKRMATLRLEEQRAQAASGRGESDTFHMVAGLAFKLLDSPYANPSADGSDEPDTWYLATRVEHWGKQLSVLGGDSKLFEEEPEESSEEEGDEEGAQKKTAVKYANRFWVMPLGSDDKPTPFRPPRITPRPEALGIHTAVVVGPGSDDVSSDSPDPYGRVKVQFHWDHENPLDGKNYGWVRVSQAWAGDGWGAFFVPRVGDEVLVAFIAGDPDRPIIVGRVHNADRQVPTTKPEHSVIRTCTVPRDGDEHAYNEIRFDDVAGQEQLRFHAAKNCDTEVGGDHTLFVREDKCEQVDGDRFITVKKSSAHVAKSVLLQAEDAIVLQVGSNTVMISEDGINGFSTKGVNLSSGLGANFKLSDQIDLCDGSTAPGPDPVQCDSGCDLPLAQADRAKSSIPAPSPAASGTPVLKGEHEASMSSAIPEIEAQARSGEERQSPDAVASGPAAAAAAEGGKSWDDAEYKGTTQKYGDPPPDSSESTPGDTGGGDWSLSNVAKFVLPLAGSAVGGVLLGVLAGTLGGGLGIVGASLLTAAAGAAGAAIGNAGGTMLADMVPADGAGSSGGAGGVLAAFDDQTNTPKAAPGTSGADAEPSSFDPSGSDSTGAGNAWANVQATFSSQSTDGAPGPSGNTGSTGADASYANYESFVSGDSGAPPPSGASAYARTATTDPVGLPVGKPADNIA